MKRIALFAMAGAMALGSAPAQIPTPAQAPADFGYTPVSPGSWSYRPVAGGSEANFIDATGRARMVIACGKVTRLVTLSRISSAPASSLSFWTSSMSRNLPSRFDQPGGRVIAQVGASDALLDAMALSRGRFAVSMPGSPALVLPVGAEVDHVVEDCRS
ncbi:MAG TPA: hypothetical protein VKA61_12430 [Sphingomicrobium sp.]|nr:hypothetical protein [Sphingomicrobium sp.]